MFHLAESVFSLQKGRESLLPRHFDNTFTTHDLLSNPGPDSAETRSISINKEISNCGFNAKLISKRLTLIRAYLLHTEILVLTTVQFPNIRLLDYHQLVHNRAYIDRPK